jgi:hypothetical protein
MKMKNREREIEVGEVILSNGGYFDEELGVYRNIKYGYDYDSVGLKFMDLMEGDWLKDERKYIELYCVVGYYYGEMMYDFESDKVWSKKKIREENGRRVDVGIGMIVKNEVGVCEIV